MVSQLSCSPGEPAGTGSTRWGRAGSAGDAQGSPGPPGDHHKVLAALSPGSTALGTSRQSRGCRDGARSSPASVVQGSRSHGPGGPGAHLTPGDGDGKPERGPAGPGTSAPDPGTNVPAGTNAPQSFWWPALTVGQAPSPHPPHWWRRRLGPEAWARQTRATKSPSHMQGWRAPSSPGPLRSPAFPFVTSGSEAQARSWRWQNNPSHARFSPLYSLAAPICPLQGIRLPEHLHDVPQGWHAQGTKRHCPGSPLPPTATLGSRCSAKLSQPLLPGSPPSRCPGF